MKLGMVLMFGLACATGMAADAAASVFGLIAWANVDDWVAKLLIGLVGLAATFFVACTKYVWHERTPVIFKGVWLLCMILDVATNLIGFVHFIVAKQTLADEVETSVAKIWGMLVARPDMAVAALLITLILHGATISTSYCVDAAAQEQR